MKYLLNISISIVFILILSMASFASSLSSPKSEEPSLMAAHFSPMGGKIAFQEIFSEIQKAKESIYITAYSWRVPQLRKSIASALSNDYCVEFVNPWAKDEECLRYQKKSAAQVYLVLDKGYEKARIEDIEFLESLGAQIRISTKKMHEKFVIVDDRFIMNTSANFSTGAQNRFSESFVMFSINDNSPKSLHWLKSALKREFAIIWNAGREQKIDDDVYATPHPLIPMKSLPDLGDTHKQVEFLSSSMNFNIKTLDRMEKDGSYIHLKSAKTFVVVDRIVELIDGANHSVSLNMNYILLKSIYKALQRAYNRGLSIRIINDYQNAGSWKDYSNHFDRYVKKKDPKAPAPARFKFYGLQAKPQNMYLNHNKYILIDYYRGSSKPVRENTLLIFGSHNLSNMAETNQFDNMMVFKTSLFVSIYNDFSNDFEDLWMLGRDKKDKPKSHIWEYYLIESRDGTDPLHLGAEGPDKTITLTYKEIKKLKEIRKSMGISKRLTPNEP